MSYFPDYEALIEQHAVLPYRDTPYDDVSFADPLLTGYRAMMIEDSTTESGSRLATMICRFPRAILSEMNTHRVFSRNSASSRARSIRTVISDVLDHPYVPIFTRNQKGMSGDVMSDESVRHAREIWLSGRDKAVETELRLLLGDLYDDSLSFSELVDVYYNDVYNAEESRGLSVHKQNANRVVEPYLWHEAVITSNFWDNFITLRADFDHADPAIYAIAVLMNRLLNISEPTQRSVHVPFVSDQRRLSGQESFDQAYDTLMQCSAEAAKISYHDRSGDHQKAASVSLGERLLADQHLSPFEHIAVRPTSALASSVPRDQEPWSNFSSDWWQLRQLLP